MLLIVKSSKSLVDDIKKKEIYVKQRLPCEKWVFRNGQRGCRDGRMVVGFTTTYAISAYHHGR